MATALSFTTAKKMVIAALQASQSAWSATVDGSVESYNSDDEIYNAILTADGIVCTAIANAMQSPFQSTFIQTSGALTAPAQPLPARNGALLKVQVTSGFDNTFTSADVFVGSNYIEISNHGFITGQMVRLTNAGTLPTGLSAGVDYYIIRLSSSTYRFATTSFNAGAGIGITMTGVGSGTTTVTSQYIEGTQGRTKDEVFEAWNNPTVFTTQGRSGACGFWFIEGDQAYSSSPLFKVVYTDYTLTAAPQAPEPYLEAVVSGAIEILAKDGSDAGLAEFNGQQFKMYLGQIAQGATILAPIQQYKP